MQAVHAAGESAHLGPQGHASIPPGTHAIVLEASPADLARLHAKLCRLNIPHAPVIESDPPFAGCLMALGLPPMTRPRGHQLFSNLPLYGKPTSRKAPKEDKVQKLDI